MNSVIDSLQTWARSLRAAAAEPQPDLQEPVAFRLCAWPELPDALRTARVLRLLSTMSVRPVNRRWMMWQSKLGPREIEALLAHLEQQGALQQLVLPPAAAPASTLNYVV